MRTQRVSEPSEKSKLVCLPELIHERACLQPQAIAVRTKHRRFTFQQLDQQANRFAKALLKAGVTLETLVAVCMDRSPESLAALLGIWKVGAAYLALDPITPPERLAFMLQDNATPLVLADRHLVPRLPSNVSRVLYADDILSDHRSVVHNIQVEISPESLAYVLYTSGSTGTPKGVELNHGGLANVVTALAAELQLRQEEVLLAHTSWSFDVSILELFLPLVSGGCVYLADSGRIGDGARLIRLLDESNATTMLGTCTLWRLLLDAGWEGKPDLRAISGGEVLSLDLAKALLERTAEVWNQYGPSEATICATTTRIHSLTETVSIGRPLPHVTLHVLDSNLQPVTEGALGELYIGGPGVARGYRNRPDLTAASFPNDPFQLASGARLYKTGDLASRLADGRLEFHGRIDYQVKIHGYRIELGEIETQLCGFPGLSTAVVSALQEGPGDQRLVAWFQAKQVITPSELREFLRSRLPAYMVPSEFRPVKSMPLNDSGKIDRKSLERQPFAVSETTAALADDVESQLRSIWESLLHIRPIALTDSFFDLGGDSLLVALLLTRVEKQFGHRLSPDTLLEFPTIKSLAIRLKRKHPDHSAQSVVPLRAEGSKPPLFIVHGLGGSLLLFRSLAAHLGDDQPVYGVSLPSGTVSHIDEVGVKALAAKFLAQIRLLFPFGPYHIAGHSFGAVVAFELASQLVQAGETPGLLALIEGDRRLLKGKPPEGFATPTHLLRRYKAKLKSLTEKGVAEVFRRRLEHVRLRSQVRLAEKALDGEILAGAFDAKELMVLAARSYDPAPYAGKAILLRATDEVRRDADRDLGWTNLITEGLEIVDVPGAHLTIFDPPNVSVLAVALNQRLAQASPDSRPVRKRA